MLSLTEHRLVPKHEILKENEVKELFEKYKINPKKLPRVSQNDPIIKMLDAKIGDIVRIDRPSETAKFATYYRAVVKG